MRLEDLISDKDWELMHEGTHKELYRIFGAHLHKEEENSIYKTSFCVYAPNAKHVNIIGDFNDFRGLDDEMQHLGNGVYYIEYPYNLEHDAYMYRIHTKQDKILIKTDPFAFMNQIRPSNKSVVYDIDGYHYERPELGRVDKNQPILVYEVHLGSLKKHFGFKKYSHLVEDIINECKHNNYNYVELLPITEHPFDGSWGYQSTGYFAPTSRYGTPKDLMYMIDRLHQEGIRVILDFVPVHTNKDDNALNLFDGSNLYMYNDEHLRENHEWGTVNFDLSKGFVNSFLISSCNYFIEYYKVDGFRVDAVSHLVYIHGNGHNGYNQPGIEFAKKLNYILKQTNGNILTFAEDSSIYQGVTKSVNDGGLGFDYKWNLGWMHDTLEYFKTDPIFRQYNQGLLLNTFEYTKYESYILPISHDEVVHEKGSLINKMFGDYETKFKNLKLFIMYMIGHPGKKLMFMGQEFAQFDEWNEYGELTWELYQYPIHKNYNDFYREMFSICRDSKALNVDSLCGNYKLLDVLNNKDNIFVFTRDFENESILFIFNFSQVDYSFYEIVNLENRTYYLVIRSDEERFSGENKSKNNQSFINQENNKIYIAGLTGYVYRSS